MDKGKEMSTGNEVKVLPYGGTVYSIPRGHGVVSFLTFYEETRGDRTLYSPSHLDDCIHGLCGIPLGDGGLCITDREPLDVVQNLSRELYGCSDGLYHIPL